MHNFKMYILFILIWDVQGLLRVLFLLISFEE